MENKLLQALAVGALACTVQLAAGQVAPPAKSLKSTIERGLKPEKHDLLGLKELQAPQPSAFRGTAATPPPPDWGREIGWSFRGSLYDGAPSTLLTRFPNGSVAAVWRYALNQRPTGLMTGYNATDANGNWLQFTNGSADSLRIIYLNQWVGAANRIPFRVPCLAANVQPRYGASNTGVPNNIENGDWRYPSIAALPDGKEVVSFFSFPRNNPAVCTDDNERKVVTVTRNANGDPNNNLGNGPEFLGTRFHNHDLFDGKMVAATNGTINMLYQVGIVLENNDLMGKMFDTSGIQLPICVLKSSDAAQTWQRISLPGMTVRSGIRAVKFSDYAIAARNNTVAVVANVIYGKPKLAVATMLWKSTDMGSSWTMSEIDKVNLSDTNRVFLSTVSIGSFIASMSDGCNNINIDGRGIVHFATGRGYIHADTTEADGGSFWPNASLLPNFGSILYWNETMAGQRPKIAARVIGTNIPPGTNPQGPGTYNVAFTSMPNIVMDESNADHVYIIYSGVVAGTQVAAGRVTRDILGVVSLNGGKSFSDQQFLSARAEGFDDGSGGSSALEDAYPVAAKFIGSDNRINVMWGMDNQPGRPATGAVQAISILGTSFHKNRLSRANIAAEFPQAVCAGSNFAVPYLIAPGVTYNAQNEFRVELDTSAINPFTDPNKITRLGVVTSNADGTISCLVPNTIQQGIHNIRVISSNYATANDSTGGKRSAVSTIAVTAAVPTTVMRQVSTLPAANGTGALSICGSGLVMLTAETSGNEDFTDVQWNITPANAGKLVKTSSTTADFAIEDGFSGAISITTTPINGCGAGTTGGTARVINVSQSNIVVNLTGSNTLTGSRVVFLSGAPAAGTPITYILTTIDANLSVNRLTTVSTSQNVLVSQLFPGLPTTIASGTIQAEINGCLSKSAQVLPVARALMAEQGRLMVYPNPATSQINIGLETNLLTQKTSAQLYNAMGQMIRTATLAQEGGILASNMSTVDLPRGVYTLKVVNNKAIQTRQIVLE